MLAWLDLNLRCVFPGKPLSNQHLSILIDSSTTGAGLAWLPIKGSASAAFA